jgi:hypothetical protein
MHNISNKVARLMKGVPSSTKLGLLAFGIALVIPMSAFRAEAQVATNPAVYSVTIPCCPTNPAHFFRLISVASPSQTNVITFTGTVQGPIGSQAVMGESVVITTLYNPNDLTLLQGNGSTSEASMFSSPDNLWVSINGGASTLNNGYHVSVNDDTTDLGGNNMPAVSLLLAWGTGNAVDIYYQSDTVTTTSPSAIATLFSSGTSLILPYDNDNTFYVGMGTPYACQGVVNSISVAPYVPPTNTPPALSICLSGSNVILTWPTNTASGPTQGYALQTSPTTANPAWTTVTNQPVLANASPIGPRLGALPNASPNAIIPPQGTNYSVTLPLCPSNAFFRSDSKANTEKLLHH